LMSENPARLVGLYPRKGTLQIGSDADLVVFDPLTIRDTATFSAPIRLPAGIDARHGCHLFVIRLDLDKLGGTREDFRRRLEKGFGVGTAVHYPAVWDWEVAETFPFDNRDCPETERACRSVVSLPVFPNSTEEDLDHIARSVRQVVGELRKG